jgi:nucleoid DNA-binding protein
VTKQELIEAVSRKTGRGKAEVGAVVDSMLETIADTLQGSERIDL